ncbi:MAG: hypothetical protein IKD09_03705 [Lentisphaeria bacterium]|nr:hypothetical protein [Lentisphaeria bacterium]
MVKKFILIDILLLAGVVAYFVFFRTDERELVKKQLIELARLSSKGESEKTTTMIIKNQSLQKIFAPECELHFGINMFDGKFSNLQLVNSISQANMYLQSSVIKASDIEVFLIDEQNAEADFTGEFKGRSKSGEYIEEVRALSAKMQKIDGEWVITAITIQKVLEK